MRAPLYRLGFRLPRNVMAPIGRHHPCVVGIAHATIGPGGIVAIEGISREAVFDQAQRLLALHARGLPLEPIAAQLSCSDLRGRDSLSIITDVEIAFAFGAVPPTMYRRGRRVA